MLHAITEVDVFVVLEHDFPGAFMELSESGELFIGYGPDVGDVVVGILQSECTEHLDPVRINLGDEATEILVPALPDYRDVELDLHTILAGEGRDLPDVIQVGDSSAVSADEDLILLRGGVYRKADPIDDSLVFLYPIFINPISVAHNGCCESHGLDPGSQFLQVRVQGGFSAGKVDLGNSAVSEVIKDRLPFIRR
jgi:hypothetical protein